MEELKQTTDIPFVNEIVMNEYTLREIMLDLWTYKATRNRLPLIIYLAAVIIPMIYAFISGKKITKGKWDDFIPFFKQKLKLTGK